MSEKNLHFSIIDYALFVATLMISMLIGVYYQFFKKQSTSHELLMGGRQMPLIPTAMSLMASFVSGISFLAFPAELYAMSAGVCWLMFGGAILADVITALFVIPIVYDIKGISIYRYFEQRFESKALRMYSSVVFTVATTIWISVALYAPSVALAKVTGFPLWIMILSLGVVCAVYTAMGGLKAVVWTDTFQAVIMYGGLIAAIVKGTMVVGGGSEIMKIASEKGRLQGFLNVDFSPFQYMSVWIGVFGGTFMWLGGYGTNQLAQQRYRSLPSVRKAQFVVVMNIPIIIVIYFLIYYNALIMFGYYSDCDPLATGQVKSRDQLVVYYTMDLLGSVYGLPGLFLASICSATLSTISSGLNAMAAVALDDYIRPFWPKMSDKNEGLVTKIVSLIFGVIVVSLAFAAEPMGGVFVTTQKVIGVIGGPLVGLMLFGIFVPKAERVGAFCGIIFGTTLAMWVFVGATVNNVHFSQLPSSVDGCAAKNVTFSPPAAKNDTFLSSVITSSDNENVSNFYQFSFSLYSLLGGLPVVIVGTPISYFLTFLKNLKPKLLTPIRMARVRPVVKDGEIKETSGEASR